MGGIQVSSKGVISAGSSGIVVENTATFGGGITNNGKIAALGQHGILVSNVAVVGTGGPGGGITNTGAISVSNAAIEVSKGGGSFAGGISNSGKLTAAGEGIFVESIGVFGNASATGTISGRHTGIAVVGIATFAGAIANISGGKIASKTQAGILVSRVAAFGGGGAGGIFNSGTISAKTGISIADSTITGAIFDFGGSILATSHGIVIGSGSESRRRR